MTPRSREETPFSGYLVNAIQTTHVECVHRTPSEDVGRHGLVTFGWDWRQYEAAIQVRLSVTVEPSKQREELIKVDVVGTFAKATERPNIPLQDFVGLQATAILMPYARQVLSSASMFSPYGPYFLPVVNVVSVMAGMNPAIATGAKQLAETSAQPLPSKRSRPRASNRKRVATS